MELGLAFREMGERNGGGLGMAEIFQWKEREHAMEIWICIRLVKGF